MELSLRLKLEHKMNEAKRKCRASGHEPDVADYIDAIIDVIDDALMDARHDGIQDGRWEIISEGQG